MAPHCCVKICGKINASEMKEDEYNKAKQFRLFSITRPHMRAFHASWFSFFIAFTSWFGIQPLLPTIIKELHLSKQEVANSGIASVAATIVVRVFAGPVCDKFGPRRVMSALLITGSIPLMFAGLIQDGTGLIIVRLFIGVLGATFVPCQFWTSVMFNYKIVGTANALVGGWGNLGGGFTFLLMPGLFKLFQYIGRDEFLAWKVAVIVPAIICTAIGISILYSTDDCPQGEWTKRRHPHMDVTELEGQNDAMLEEEEDLTPEMKKKIDELNKQPHSWTILTLVLLIIQYGMCFGVEISTNTILNLYLLYKFKVDDCNDTVISTNENSTMEYNISDDEFYCSVLNQNTASSIASLFGLMNLFARALGGSFSDGLYRHFRIPGRLLAHNICLAGEGLMLIILSQINSIPLAIFVLIITSIFVQASEGTTYSIVPYVHQGRVGVIAGFVGAGGNAGAFVWNTIWGQLIDHDPSWWFWIVGVIVFCGSFLTLLIRVEGTTIWSLRDDPKKDKDKT